MNQQILDKVVNAVLYEGYILYPYRPSVKNRQRWTFGGLYPASFHLVREGAEACLMQTECIVEGTADSVLDVKIRFLHLSTRSVGEIAEPLEEWPAKGKLDYRDVECLRVGGKLHQSWQEATEREVAVGQVKLSSLLSSPRSHSFAFEATRGIEPLRREDGKVGGVLIRTQRALAGEIEVSAQAMEAGAMKVTVRITNRSPLDRPDDASRDDAILSSFASTHTILTLRDGAFVSSIDPPEAYRGRVGACRNIGAFPVLVGEAGERDTLLSSPIILYDYPQIAPESPGSLFDSTEIDEILSLRVMTLTDEEKQAVADVDERAGALLARTEALDRGQMASLHGAMRGANPAARSSLLPSYSGGGLRWGARVDDALLQTNPPPPQPQPSPGVPGEGERAKSSVVPEQSVAAGGGS